MIPLTGYADRLSVRPDETISFHVFHNHNNRRNDNDDDDDAPLAVRAHIVRVISADPHTNPGPGIQTTPLHSGEAAGSLLDCLVEPSPCTTQLGSHAEIPLPASFWNSALQKDGFTLVVNVFPTWLGNQKQSIASIKNLFDLYLNPVGHLELDLSSLGSASSRPDVSVSCSKTPLAINQWACVGFTVDPSLRTVTLAWMTLPDKCGALTVQLHETVTAALPENSYQEDNLSTTATCLVLAATRQTNHDEQEKDKVQSTCSFSCHYNGRLEYPRLWKRAIDLSSLMTTNEKYNNDDIPTADAAWDFGLAMTTQTIQDVGPHGLHGKLINFPTRAVRGSQWSGREMSWRHAPSSSSAEYAAIHFHASDFGDCQWPICYQWKVPLTLKSGIYALMLSARNNNGEEEYQDNIPFFVVPPKGQTQARVALIVPTFTYIIYSNHARSEWENDPQWQGAWKSRVQANPGAYPYNPRQHAEYGWSTYNNHVDGSGVALTTWRRPMLNVRIGYITFPYPDLCGSGLRHFPADTHLTAWLESQGIAYDVVTDWELHSEGSQVLEPYRVVLTGSHPEYYTEESWNAMKDYRDSGGRFCYLGGNGFYWKIAVDNENGVMEIRRGEGGIRAWASQPGEYYHQLDGGYGGLWRRNGRAPQALAGVGFTAQGNFVGSYYRIKKSARTDPRTSWMFDGITEDIIGNHGLSGHGAAGFELDRVDFGLGTPRHAVVVAASEGHDPDAPWVLVFEERLTHHGNLAGVPDDALIRSDIAFFETPNGGAVFSTGSITFCGSLLTNAGDNDISTLLKNVVNKFLDPQTTFSLRVAPPERLATQPQDPQPPLAKHHTTTTSMATTPKTTTSRPKHRLRNNFENAKAQCRGKRDKSSAGRIDPHAVEICAVLNERTAWFTTSSCAGRCFLYRGQGIKSTQQFQRFRVSHDCIRDPERYFNLETIESDPSGGGDPIRTIGQFEHAERVKEMHNNSNNDTAETSAPPNQPSHEARDERNASTDASIWLRFEPFILHVACRSLAAAQSLMNAARPSFKNVGLTTWKEDSSRFLVAIWGDEGLEMPLSTPDGTPLFVSAQSIAWLASLVNERHARNWNKIDRFVKAVREMPAVVDDLDAFDDLEGAPMTDYGAHRDMSVDEAPKGVRVPRSFDVVGNVAVLHSLTTTDVEERKQIGEAIMKKNKAIKVVVLRKNNMEGTERSPGINGFTTLAGATRSPLITTHNEHGIKCVVDLEHTFFSPRMGAERMRICQQVARGEHILVLFCGVAMDCFQLAGRSEATSIVAVEMNEVAIKCARLGHRMLERNKAVKCVGAAERLEIIQGDVLDVLPTLPRNHFDRIVAPRPKEGSLDGDLGTGEGGLEFLEALLPVLKQNGGECHWYEFVADHEFPVCARSRKLLNKACASQGLTMDIIHVANAGSVAMRQLRVCIDFRVFSGK